MSTLFEKYPNIFINNKYLKWYEGIILNPTNYGCVEKHHIIPKSIIKNNMIVSLSLRQHYIAHLLLVKCINPLYKKKMIYAVTAMKIRVMSNIKFNSRIFERLKTEANIQRSLHLTGRTHSEQTKEKIRKKRSLQVISDETRKKMSESRMGKKNSREAIERTRQSNIGRKRSELTRQRLREERANRKPIICEHCGSSFLPGNYHRWHGDNCKHQINDET